MDATFRRGLADVVNSVYRGHAELHDHRLSHPWLVGALGDPDAGIWFVGENPSLRQVERARNPGGGELTEEAQWSASSGDKLLRKMLVQHGFKNGTVDSLGGWRCYITNVIKEADYAREWRERSAAKRRQAAEAWTEVLKWELEESRPVCVVAMGKESAGLLKHLARTSGLRLPEMLHIPHYSGVAMRPSRGLGPGHPERLRSYDEEFGRVARRYQELAARSLSE